MLGYNKCIICKTPNPYKGANEANRNGWAKLILRNDYYGNNGYKYVGLVCSRCAMSKIKPLYFDREEENDEKRM